jgi:hypothetical protein
VVLDRLEGPDGAPELFPYLGVLDGHVQGRPADAHRFGRGQYPENRPGVARRAAKNPLGGHGHAVQHHRPDAARGVQTLKRGHRYPGRRRLRAGVDDHDILAGDQHEQSGVRGAQHGGAFARHNMVRTYGHAARHAEGRECLTGGQAGE